MAVKKAIIKAMVEESIVELMVKSRVDNVYLTDDSTTLAAKLTEMITSLNGKATKEEMDQAISTAITNLVNGAPETFDTLKEIADYLSNHQDEYTALLSVVGNKVEKENGKGLSTNDFSNSYKAVLDGLGALASKSTVSMTDLSSDVQEKINAASEGNHSHSNMDVLNTITGEKVSSWDGKAKIYVQTDQPATLSAGDLWIMPTD